MKKVTGFFISFFIFYAVPTSVNAATYYVSTSGSNANTTAQAQNISTPWQTIQNCISKMVAGDTCVIRGGTYPETVTISKSGTANNLLSIINYQNEKPIIDGQSSRATMTLSGANYLIIDGLTLLNSNSFALYSISSNNISVINSEVDHPLDGGLVFRNGTNILVNNSNVHHTNWRGDGNHEAISMVNVNGFEVKNSQVHDSKEEGIDAKYGTANGKIHHNKVYANGGPNIYIDAAGNIEIFNNEVYVTTADKSNIGLAVEQHINEYITENILIYNNIIRSGTRGVSFWVEPGAEGYAKFSSIYMYNNLFYALSANAIRNSGFQQYFNDVQIKNNIFWKNQNNIDSVNSTVTSNNLFDDNPLGSNTTITSNVGFVNEASMNFHLNSNSPAIDKGIAVTVTRDYDGVSRPQGSAIDIGPYEFQNGAFAYNNADLEPDGDVDIYDYSRLVSDFGKTGIIGWIRSDIVKNGAVDIFDYSDLVANFGK